MNFDDFQQIEKLTIINITYTILLIKQLCKKAYFNL